jgi:hypothetical protein
MRLMHRANAQITSAARSPTGASKAQLRAPAAPVEACWIAFSRYQAAPLR